MRIRRHGEYTVSVDGATMRFQRTADMAAIALSLMAQWHEGLPPERVAGLMRGLGQVLTGWEGVEDETGAPLPATLEHWEAFLAECPQHWLAIITGIAEQLVAETGVAVAAEGSDPQ